MMGMRTVPAAPQPRHLACPVDLLRSPAASTVNGAAFATTGAVIPCVLADLQKRPLQALSLVKILPPSLDQQKGVTSNSGLNDTVWEVWYNLAFEMTD